MSPETGQTDKWSGSHRSEGRGRRPRGLHPNDDPPKSEPTVSSSEPGARAFRRRALLVSGAVLAAAGLGAFERRRRRIERQEASELVQASELALERVDISGALESARVARALDATSERATLAWVRASVASLLDADAEPRRGIALIDEVRAAGLRDAPLGMVLLATATRGRNDRLATKLLAQHAEQGLAGDPHYEYAAGAALELCCDGSAPERFASAVRAAPSATLPKIRLARSLLLFGRIDEARRALEPLARRPERAILAEVATRISRAAPFSQVVDPFAIPDLPRSVRPLAQALLVFEGNQGSGLEAALADIDSPETAMLLSKLMLAMADPRAARQAAEAALRLRPELGAANELLVRLDSDRPLSSPSVTPSSSAVRSAAPESSARP
jgi:hypothetical protein